MTTKTLSFAGRQYEKAARAERVAFHAWTHTTGTAAAPLYTAWKHAQKMAQAAWLFVPQSERFELLDTMGASEITP